MTVSANNPIKATEMTVKSVANTSDIILAANTTNNFVYTVNTISEFAAWLSFKRLPKYATANVPAANVTGNNAGLIFVTDGANGSPCIAISNGSAWSVLVAVVNTALSNT